MMRGGCATPCAAPPGQSDPAAFCLFNPRLIRRMLPHHSSSRLPGYSICHTPGPPWRPSHPLQTWPRLPQSSSRVVTAARAPARIVCPPGHRSHLPSGLLLLKSCGDLPISDIRQRLLLPDGGGRGGVTDRLGQQGTPSSWAMRRACRLILGPASAHQAPSEVSLHGLVALLVAWRAWRRMARVYACLRVASGAAQTSRHACHRGVPPVEKIAGATPTAQ
jgi:hypothetical protein